MLKIKEFKNTLDEAIEEQIENEIERLQEKYPEEYSLGHDRDYVDVGVGGCGVCVRDDEIWDDDRLREDAVEIVTDEFFQNLADSGKDTKSAKLCDLIQQYVRSK